ncbi:hypothetical protein RNN62_26695, partial [Escherichia coli]|nr:hypothetical protein [Escherichia coli]
MLPSETMIWQPEFTDKTLSRKPGAVHESQFRLSVVPEGKTMYVLLPQIASLKLSDVSGIFTSGYHYNKLRAK